MFNAFLSKPGIWAIVLAVEGVANMVPTEFAALANLGAIGCVLLWFMLRSEPRQRKLEEAMDRQTRMYGLVIIALKQVHPAVKEQVEAVMSEVSDAEAARKK